MKKAFLYLIVALTSCAMNTEQAAPTPDPAPCNIGYWKAGGANNMLFVRTTAEDTITALWQSPSYGLVLITWITGQIDWNCIGFTMDNDLSITLMTATDTCYFHIPKKDQ